MKPQGHLIVSTVVSAGVYAVTHSWTPTLVSWVAGTLIDTDHVADYAFENKKISTLPAMIAHYTNHQYKKCVVMLHGWEYIPVIASIAWFTGHWDLGMAALIGYTQHLCLDQWKNNLHPLFYFLTFRIYHQFEPIPLGAKRAV